MAFHFPLKTHRQLLVGPTPEEKLAAVETCLFAGDKIQAIRIYREWKGGGLAECKAAIEGMESQLRLTNPEKFQPAASGRGIGCSAVALLLLAGLAGAVGWWLSQ
jgi:hypothetical protein